MSTQKLYDYLAARAAATAIVSGDKYTILKGAAVQTLDYDYELSTLTAAITTSITAALRPPGFIDMTAAVDIPTGWLWCDGTAYSRTTYAALYNNITKTMGDATVSIATPGVVTLNAHGRETGDIVEWTTTGALPTGLSINTNYWVIYVNANTFRIATTLANAIAGTAINTSGTQSGTHSLRYCPFGISTAANFLVPDSREASFYGVGTRGSGVTAHDAKVFGQFADDQAQGDYPYTLFDTTGNAFKMAQTNSSAGSGLWAPILGGSGNELEMRGVKANATDGTPRRGTVTRGKILGMKFIIKV